MYSRYRSYVMYLLVVDEVSSLKLVNKVVTNESQKIRKNI